MSSHIVEVCKIDKIKKHENADKLRIAKIKGWQCIIGLTDFQEGDLVVFIPPDSILPEALAEEYKLEYLKKGARVRTIKLRGFISQGLCLPIPKGAKWQEGLNVAEKLGIKKYEPPQAHYQGKTKETVMGTYLKYREGKISFRRFLAKSIGIIKDSFKPKKNINPLFSKYTDIENIKNFHTVFKTGDEVVITEKIHGSNFRAGCLLKKRIKLLNYFLRKLLKPLTWNNGMRYSKFNKIKKWITKFCGDYEFVYGSHRVQITKHRGRNCFYGDDVYGQIAERYKLADIIPEDFLIYGELYGKKIQELEYGLTSIDVVFFDVKHKGKYLDYTDVVTFLRSKNLPIVPELFRGRITEDTVKLCTNGESILASGKKQIREGCVVKAEKEENHPRIGRKILKSISEKYLVTKKRTEHH